MELGHAFRGIASGVVSFAIGLGIGWLMTVLLLEGPALFLESSITVLVFLSTRGRLPSYRTLLKMAGVTLVLAEAMAHPPIQFMDGTIGTFTSEPTLDEVLKRSDFSCDSAACNPLRSTRVPVPLGVDLTRGEVAAAIERSLPLKLRLQGCLTGASMRIPMAVSPTFY